ncbi:DnaJ C-terminal domain-containing protein [Marinicella sediminis]|uniref:DnaJ C-terminal domain-containing protein n=1 Tax=Marinicella sediminis TaxID=1792834 RepID=A0ABV7JF63_9GAMM|nr:DnaJ C-terminal domain-containing protein [Marinicella sediminis]
MDFKDYYEILGLDDKADLKAIKAAYRRLARKYHPDVSKDANAEENFKAVAEAYAVLKNPEKKAEYDDLRHQFRSGEYSAKQQSRSGDQPPGEYDFSDFFESVFNQASASERRANAYSKQAAHKGQDLEMSLAISLEEALSGGDKTISFQLPKERQAKTLKVKIPPHTLAGDLIRLKGQGMPGSGKAQAGDIYLNIQYAPHKYFDVTGLDVFLTVPVSPWEAALGTQIIIPTLTSKLNLTVQPNSQTGQKQRIKNKGLKSKHESGDLFVIFKVVMPDSGTTEMNHIWQQMAETSSFNPRSDWS